MPSNFTISVADRATGNGHQQVATPNGCSLSGAGTSSGTQFASGGDHLAGRFREIHASRVGTSHVGRVSTRRTVRSGDRASCGCSVSWNAAR